MAPGRQQRWAHGSHPCVYYCRDDYSSNSSGQPCAGQDDSRDEERSPVFLNLELVPSANPMLTSDIVECTPWLTISSLRAGIFAQILWGSTPPGPHQVPSLWHAQSNSQGTARILGRCFEPNTREEFPSGTSERWRACLSFLELGVLKQIKPLNQWWPRTFCPTHGPWWAIQNPGRLSLSPALTPV